ncbi:MAG TPA: PCRF domain-containing protein, partial [Spirochaetia bacterium]|nr:PCRF domain-containing protein [Spirochaetia bacterium]
MAELEAQTGDPHFWDNHDRAESILTNIKRLRSRIEPWEELRQEVLDLDGLLSLALSEKDASMESEIQDGLERSSGRYQKLRALELLSSKQDVNPAFLTIHAGAGGTEACDWVSMLLRMYLRWTERRGFKT